MWLERLSPPTPHQISVFLSLFLSFYPPPPLSLPPALPSSSFFKWWSRLRVSVLFCSFLVFRYPIDFRSTPLLAHNSRPLIVLFSFHYPNTEKTKKRAREGEKRISKRDEGRRGAENARERQRCQSESGRKSGWQTGRLISLSQTQLLLFSFSER